MLSFLSYSADQPARQAIIIPSSYDGLWRIIFYSERSEPVEPADTRRELKISGLSEFFRLQRTI